MGGLQPERGKNLRQLLPLLLLLSCSSGALERPHPTWRAKNLVVLVGEKLSLVERAREEDSEVLALDLGFDAKYRVLEVIYGHHEAETIEFIAWDHYGRPEFEDYGTVLLYIARGEDGYVHHKYLFQPVYPTATGGWAGCGDPYAGMAEELRLDVRAGPVAFEPEVRFETGGLTAKERASRYPAGYFEHRDGAAFCKSGASLEELFEVMRDGYLGARGVFGSWKQYRTWRRHERPRSR